jgi:glycosyltransferase involved in cell wall biosynthesis
MLSGGLRTKGITKQSKENIPLITVVTVVRNCEKMLEETILSVINQTYNNIEYIIIDGGSTDCTLDIIRKYEDKIDYWISEPDDGVYYAMNKGIDLATGDWLNFMNSGDSFYSKTVLQNVFETESMDADIIYGDTLRIYYFGPFIEKARPINDSMKKRMPFIHQSSFVKTKLMKKCKFDETYRICGDRQFFCDCYANNKKFIYYPLIIAVYDSKYGISSNNYLLVEYELARINGIEKKITWKIKYRVYCNIKSVIKKMLPKFIVQKIEVSIYMRQCTPLKSLFL